MLQITTAKGPFDLPSDVELSIDEVNVLWSDETSHSLPLKVSYTQHNLALLGHPERYENATHEVNISCIVSHTCFKKQGVIKFVTINREEKALEFSMLLDEGSWFEWAKNTKLEKIAWPAPITVSYAASGDAAAKFKAKKEALEKLTENAWYATTDPDYYESCLLKAEFTDCAFLSAIKEWEQGAGYNESPWGMSSNPETYHLAKYDIVNKYGLAVGAATPLLYIRTILKYLFADWVVENNPFLKGDLARAFIFNDNVTYFENGSKIDYSKLVPDETIEKFIALCEGVSGTKMVVDPINKIVKFFSIKERLLSKAKEIATPLNVNTKEVEGKRLSINVNVVSNDYVKTHENCTEELLKSGRVKVYPTINYQQRLLRDKKDSGEPWNTCAAFKEQVIFDKATQCFGIEKWERKENDVWTFNRTLLSNRFYPTLREGNKEEVLIESVATNALIAFSQYFLDATGNELSLETHYVLSLPFFPCRYESSNAYMHDFEKIFFNKNEATGKLACSIQRGLHRVYWRKNQYNVMIRQEGERDVYDDWGSEKEAYVDNRCFFKFANADIYDIEGEKAVSAVESADMNEYFLKKRGRLAPTNQLISLRPAGENGLAETFYREYEKFVANRVPAEVRDNCNDLNRVSLHDKVKINSQDFVIVKRKRTLTLYNNVVSTTEVAAVILD